MNQAKSLLSLLFIIVLNSPLLYASSQWTIYDSSNSAIRSFLLASVAIDRNGNKWIGGNNGLYKFDGKKWVWYNTTNSDIPDDYISVSIDSSGKKWIGTSGKGIASFDDTTWTRFTSLNSGLPYNCTLAPSFDKFGNMWVPTCGGGLAKMTKDRQWTVYNVLNSRLPSDFVQSIAFDNDSGVWIATERGLAFLNGSAWKLYTPNNSPFSDFYIGNVYYYGGAVWIGMQIKPNVYVYDGQSWKTYTASNSPLLANKVYSILFDEKGIGWFGTDAGLLKYNDGIWSEFTAKNSGLPQGSVNSLAVDPIDSSLWIAVYNETNGKVAQFKKNMPITSVLSAPLIASKNSQNLFCFQNGLNSVSISYILPQSGHTKIDVYDSKGKLIAHVLNSFTCASTRNHIKWNISQLHSGTYYIRFVSDATNISQRITLLK